MMPLRYSFSLLACLFLTRCSYAEVVLDGTLGRSGALPGPDFEIKAEDGQQLGGNLFHSFHLFNIQQGESATFSGPQTVTNIISRVTGGSSSMINGKLRSTIPNADIYLLNPAGLIFGNNARLDVQGGFHASTADTLRLGTDGHFNARQPAQSVLSVAPPSAFGFLTVPPATITMQDSKLSVTEGKTLSLVGGELNLTGTSPFPGGAKLSAKFGRINLASVASPGEVTPTQTGLDLSLGTPGGQITARNVTIGSNPIGSENAVSGQESGSIFIRAGRFELKDSLVFGTRSETNSGIVNIRADEVELQKASITTDTNGAGGGGVIVIQTKNLMLLTGAKINSSSSPLGQGDAGLITLKVTDTLTMSGSDIMNSSVEARKAGDIQIEAHRIILKDKAGIQSTPVGTGGGGSIVIKVEDDLTISNGSILGGSFSSQPTTEKGVTNIHIEARRIVLDEGAYIINGTFGGRTGGDITITVFDDLTMSGGIISSGGTTQKGSAGDSGNIEINVHQLTLQKGAIIDTTNDKGGKAGKIEIKVDQLTLKERASIRSITDSAGEGGFIRLEVADTLTISGEKDSSTGIFGNSLGKTEAGNAGEIKVQANTIKLTDGGVVSTLANQAAGGNITLFTSNLLYLREGHITTSVKGGKGDGGNIKIDFPVFLVLDKAKILAQADEGKGGNITITANHRLSSKPESNNVIDATSRKNVSGKVVIKAQDEEVGVALTILPTTLQNYEIIKKHCTVEQLLDKEKRNSFVPKGRGGVSETPTDLQAGSVRDVMEEQLW